MKFGFIVMAVERAESVLILRILGFRTSGATDAFLGRSIASCCGHLKPFRLRKKEKEKKARAKKQLITL